MGRQELVPGWKTLELVLVCRHVECKVGGEERARHALHVVGWPACVWGWGPCPPGLLEEGRGCS